MADILNGVDRLRSALVAAATFGMIAVNWLASAGRFGGSPISAVSEQYPTIVTPSNYGFTIWVLIYLGLAAFSIFQLLPANSASFRSIRSSYILSCALNCAWIFFWQQGNTGICLGLIVVLAGILFLINVQVREPESTAVHWLVKAPFGLYFGWVVFASLINLAVYLKSMGMGVADSAIFGVVIVLVAAVVAVLIRMRLTNFFFPLAIAWGLTAIAVKQSGQTLVVAACSVGVIAALIAAMSFVVNLSPIRSPDGHLEE